MKAMTIACVALGMFAAGQAMADSAVPAGTTQAAPAQTAAAMTAQAAGTGTTQVSMVADAGVSQPETRAQVYQDLVHAENNGQLKRLDASIYAHH